MRGRLALRVLLAAALLPLLLVGLVYYYFLAMMGGFLSVPWLQKKWIPVAGAGQVLLQAVGETAFRSKGSHWEAKYLPASGGKAEVIGTWFGAEEELVTALVGGRIIVVAGFDHCFVRAENGRWKTFPVRFPDGWASASIRVGDLDGLKKGLGWPPERPLPLASIAHFSPERAEVVVDLRTWGEQLAGRIFLRLASDGESFDLVRVQRPLSAVQPTIVGGRPALTPP